ncbi:MAG TPA: hypothetical protein P5523_07810 [Bacteroidales bacterium]|nr:hypothetical protein [Bacteroidales bacterium]
MEKDHLEILIENINEKFDLILEGHDTLHKKIDTVYQDLAEKIELNSFKIDAVNQKIDTVEKSLKQEIRTVADDLFAHRTDTESHRKGYKVSDS